MNPSDDPAASGLPPQPATTVPNAAAAAPAAPNPRAMVTAPIQVREAMAATNEMGIAA